MFSILRVEVHGILDLLQLDFQPKGKPVGSTRGLNKTPVIKSNARIGTTYNFSATGRPTGMQSNKVAGAIGRTTRWSIS